MRYTVFSVNKFDVKLEWSVSIHWLHIENQGCKLRPILASVNPTYTTHVDTCEDGPWYAHSPEGVQTLQPVATAHVFLLGVVPQWIYHTLNRMILQDFEHQKWPKTLTWNRSEQLRTWVYTCKGQQIECSGAITSVQIQDLAQHQTLNVIHLLRQLKQPQLRDAIFWCYPEGRVAGYQQSHHQHHVVEYQKYTQAFT